MDPRPAGRHLYTLKPAPPGERFRVQVLGLEVKGPRFFSFQGDGGRAPAWFLQYFHTPVPLHRGDRVLSLPAQTLVPVFMGQRLGYGHATMPWINSFLRVDGEGIAPLWAELGFRHGEPVAMGDGKAFRSRLDALYREMESPRGPSPVIAWGLFTALCGEVALARGLPRQGTGIPDRLESVYLAMTRHPERPWRMAEVAEDLALSPVAFHRIFTRTFGRNPGALLTDLRVRRAARLLFESDAPLRDIGEACGYPDPFHFSRVFKAKYGQSPSAFRAEKGNR